MDLDTFGQGTSDPYAVITMGVETCTSSVKLNSLHPVWDEKFKFISSNPDFEVIALTLYDEDTTTDDLLGFVELKVKEIQDAGRIVRSFELKNEERGITSGEVDIEFEWEEMFEMSTTKSE